MKVGIITFHASYNYGSMLQSYALQETLRSMNVDVKIINFRSQIQKDFYGLRHKRFGIKMMVKAWLKRAFFPSIRKKGLRFELFLNERLDLTPLYTTLEEVELCCPKFDIYLSGSDQIWNTGAFDFNLAYLLPFAGNSKRISYAASLGPTGRIVDMYKEGLQKCLMQYQSISVREQKSANLIESLIGRTVPIVLDPVFLLSAEQWEKVCPVESKISSKYIFFYTLYYEKNLDKIVKNISKFLKLPVIVTLYASKHDVNSEYVKIMDCGPCEFVKLLKNAEFVITSSFHGTAFSILFNKPFFSYNGATDARIDTLLKNCGLTDRAIDENFACNMAIDLNIDFAFANSELQKHIQYSKNYLAGALSL